MIRALVCILALLASTTAVAQPVPEATVRYGDPDAPTRMLVRSTADIDLFEPVVQLFLSSQNPIFLTYEQWGSNDLYQASNDDCRAGRAGADLVLSSSVDQQVKLANDGCAAQYRSAETARLPTVANWRDEVFGTTLEPAVIVYNRSLVPEAEAPASRFDLIDLLRPADSRYRGRIATYDIETSGLGYLFAFADAQQATTFGSLIEAFGSSGAVTNCCSSALIDGVVSGDYLVAYNVLGSYALARAEANPDLAIVAPVDYTLVLSRAALIPRRARAPAEAGAFVDFLLSDEGRAALRRANLIVETGEGAHPALNLPADPEVRLRPIPMTPALLVGLDQHKRRAFIERWRGTFRDRGAPAQ